MKTGWKTKLLDFPEGLSSGEYGGRKYQINKELFVNGRVIKFFARELGGNNFISLNYYDLKSASKLRPCEMPVEKVISFLNNVTLTSGSKTMLNWNNVTRFARNGNPAPDREVRKTDAEWREQLTEEQYRVTRKQGTERPFSSEMCSLVAPGQYSCVCCDTLLFDASEKFESGTGWPSFTQPVKPNAIAYRGDSTHGMSRIETTCNTCEAHLGHVFPDGPAPSGLRYCMNAVALKKLADK